MARLITLKLQPAIRPVNQHLLAPIRSPPPIPPKSPRRIAITMTFALPLPRSQQQWRIVLDEVRAIYLRRQYKQCAMRCIQLLDGAPNVVLSLHCIYLSFYAAICLESQARTMSINSSKKLALFQIAQLYYQKAEKYMREAESGHVITKSELEGELALENHYHLSSSSQASSVASYRSSVTSTPYSPISCTFTSPMHSPASSICSVFSKSEDEPYEQLKPRPLCVPPKPSSCWDSALPTSSAEDSSNSSTPRASRVLHSKLDTSSSQSTEPHVTTTEPTNVTVLDMNSSSFPSNSTRCNIYLTNLRTRLAHHLLIITELISSIQHDSSSTTKPYKSGRKTKHGQSLTTPTSYKTATLPDIVESEPEDLARQRTARIAQLKQRGVDWKLGRGRFDASKYERLCQDALKELQA